jgi:two-component system nitrate/nitrite response regulator NarL
MVEPQAPIRIVIADDHPLVRMGLRQLFDLQPGFTVVGEASDGLEALAQVKSLMPEVLLLDVAMPNMNGLEVLRELQETGAGVRTILLTAAIEGEEVVRALQLGARGVVLKEAATEQIYLCIRTVMKGDIWVGREHFGDLLHTLLQLQRTTVGAGPGRRDPAERAPDDRRRYRPFQQEGHPRDIRAD